MTPEVPKQGVKKKYKSFNNNKKSPLAGSNQVRDNPVGRGHGEFRGEEGVPEDRFPPPLLI